MNFIYRIIKVKKNTDINTKRTFIAIKLNPDIYFTEILNQIRKELSGEFIRWVNVSNYHVTLRFLGDTDAVTAGNVSMELYELAKNLRPFSFDIGNLGVFRSINYPRVIYTGIEDSGNLQEIRHEIDRRLAALLKDEESKKFTPHLTLGRMNKCLDRDKLRQTLNRYRSFHFLKVEVEELIFYESMFNKKGAFYSPLSVHPLGLP